MLKQDVEERKHIYDSSLSNQNIRGGGGYWTIGL